MVDIYSSYPRVICGWAFISGKDEQVSKHVSKQGWIFINNVGIPGDNSDFIKKGMMKNVEKGHRPHIHTTYYYYYYLNLFYIIDIIKKGLWINRF